jgi:hypothetical protein
MDWTKLWAIYKKLLVVLMAQALVMVAAVGLAVGAITMAVGPDSLFPRFLQVPLEPARPDASALAAGEALRRAFPGDEVRMGDAEVEIRFRVNEFDIGGALSTLGAHGFQTNRFTMGRDLGPTGLADGLLRDGRSFAIMALSLPVLLLVAGTVLRARLALRPRTRKPVRTIVIAGLAGGLALALASELVGVAMAALGYPIVEQPWIETITRFGGVAPLAIIVLVAVVLAPLGEELFYRGWVFRYLEDAGAPVAYGVSTALFAAVHLHPPALPAYLLYGLCLAALYRWSGSLWTPILAHATNNSVAMALLLVGR